MTAWKWPVLVLICLFLTLGCLAERPQRGDSSTSSSSSRSGSVPAPVRESGGDDQETRRFIAVSHSVLVEMDEAELPKAWESVGGFCKAARCEVISSIIRQKTYNTQPSATLSLRVAPEEIKGLFEHLAKVGKILEHKTESEDKTGTVIDVEAKIKNLTELRDRLRNMLASPSGSLKDVVEVERELSRAQSELDSLQMRRKALANQTEKVAVDITFRSGRSLAGTGTFSPVGTAFREAGYVLAESIAYAITFTVAIIPWLVLFVPTLWLGVKIFRNLRGKRAEPKKK